MKKTWLIILAVVVILGGFLWSTYNSLVTLNEQADGQWAQVETQYQRRFDLIPNLVNSVKGVMAQEQKVFGDLADARTKYSGALTPDEKAAAATQVEGALGRLLVVMENYPQLKSADTVQTLMSQLEGSENRISVERKRFNDILKEFNLRVKRFPGNFIAGLFGFSERAYFESVDAAAQAPEVQL
ncbi:LemA family protein [Candidatus Campbellbacteria bacterium]|nr:MAG: LemA family protein [Candidatus Campbellbacteria bacterium]